MSDTATIIYAGFALSGRTESLKAIAAVAVPVFDPVRQCPPLTVTAVSGRSRLVKFGCLRFRAWPRPPFDLTCGDDGEAKSGEGRDGPYLIRCKRMMLVFPILVCGALLGYGLLFRFVLDSKVGVYGVEVKLFSAFTVYSIPYKDVIDITEAGWLESERLKGRLFALRLENRFGRAVLIRKRGTIGAVILTPGHPAQFVAGVRQHISH